MKHLNEVCKLLMDEADQRYELTKSKLEAASLKVRCRHRGNTKRAFKSR
jgi:hypothetical protein